MLLLHLQLWACLDCLLSHGAPEFDAMTVHDLTMYALRASLSQHRPKEMQKVRLTILYPCHVPPFQPFPPALFLHTLLANPILSSALVLTHLPFGAGVRMRLQSLRA